MRLWVLSLGLIVLCVSCEATGGKTEADRNVRKAFEEWRQGVIANNFDIFFAGMTPRMRTLYFWHMVSEGNTELFEKRVPLMKKGDRTDLENWIGQNLSREEGKVNLLPISVLRGDWLSGTIKEHFAKVQKNFAFELSQIKVVEVYTEGTGSTLVVRNIRNKNEWYSMTFDGESWKIDGHRLGN